MWNCTLKAEIVAAKFYLRFCWANPYILTRLFTLSLKGCVWLILCKASKYVTLFLYKKANSSPGPLQLHFGARTVQLHKKVFTWSINWKFYKAANSIFFIFFLLSYTGLQVSYKWVFVSAICICKCRHYADLLQFRLLLHIVQVWNFFYRGFTEVFIASPFCD